MNLRLADLKVWHLVVGLIVAGFIAVLTVQFIDAHQRSAAAGLAVKCAEDAPIDAISQRLCQQGRIAP
jgi:hypothetical protein